MSGRLTVLGCIALAAAALSLFGRRRHHPGRHPPRRPHVVEDALAALGADEDVHAPAAGLVHEGGQPRGGWLHAVSAYRSRLRRQPADRPQGRGPAALPRCHCAALKLRRPPNFGDGQDQPPRARDGARAERSRQRLTAAECCGGARAARRPRLAGLDASDGRLGVSLARARRREGVSRRRRPEAAERSRQDRSSGRDRRLDLGVFERRRCASCEPHTSTRNTVLGASASMPTS